MPSKSKQQQKFFGVVKAMQKGDIPKKGEAGEVADDMTKKEVDKMASTKHKGLVNKIKELVEEEIKALIEAKLPDEGFSDPEQMREAHKLVKVLGGYPVTYEGDPNNYRAIISEPMNDRQKEDMIKKAKQAGYIAKPNMGGGVTIFVKENKITEAKSAKSLKSDYDKAVKKEQALSSLLLINLEKYKAAKANGDEKAIAKHTKIAADLSKKKKSASELANSTYKAYEDKISGLHADAELELKEGINEVSLPKFKTPYEAFSWIMGKREEAMDIETEMMQVSNDIIQTQKDMEQEASPEGGPTTDRFGSVLNNLELKHRNLRKQFNAVMAEIDEYDQNY